ncbi:hypothetical protein [Methanobrevibacter sp.]|uniref:hypothetical protein n=1 Tax=Methanobrevibacter sp. TaxID=66852 RepID=UPI0026E06D3B|nr:hypothetical protein [Methanobrevibacter sp.]MDO5859869.1 hypothetical protein [Methanobrevibacter sp.]
MNINKYPQFQLYLLTLRLLKLKNKLIPQDCDEYASIQQLSTEPISVHICFANYGLKM